MDLQELIKKLEMIERRLSRVEKIVCRWRLTGKDLKLMRLIAERGAISASDNNILDILKVRRPALSLRLNKLYLMGLLEKFLNDESTRVYYKLTDLGWRVLSENGNQLFKREDV